MARAASESSSDGGRREPNRGSNPSKPERAARPERGTATPAADKPLAPGLHLVATPIGNLDDITLRALAALRGADRIWCEDTRVTAKLLARYRISTPLGRYDDHNAEQVRPAILAALRRGERLALVCDAGTPLVCDPGYKLVRAAIAENLPVTAAPGPSAALTALILSGLPPDRFLFAGFLPPRRAARRRELARWATIGTTLICFESAARLTDSLADMAELLGDRDAAVGRELTKRFEEIRRGRLADLANHYRDTGRPRGEIAIIVAPLVPRAPEPAQIDDRLRADLMMLSVREAAARLAAETGLPRRDLYRRALAIRDGMT